MSLFGDLLNAENEKKEEREEKWVNFLAEIQRQLINKLERKKISLLKKQRKWARRSKHVPHVGPHGTQFS